MASTSTKDGLLERIERERALWERLLAEVRAERMLQPGGTGDWSFKDVVAHLQGWRTRTLEYLDAAQQGRSPEPPPWPANLDEDTDAGVDQINSWIYTTNRDQPLGQVLGAYRESFERMRAAVVALPERDLTEAGRYPWLGDRSLATVIADSFGHFHEEHEPTLRGWLERINGSSRPV